jgi:hypothetical protein
MPSAIRSRVRRTALAAILAACMPWPVPAATTPGESRVVAMRLEATGTVSSLDAGARQLTLKGPRGDASYRVDPQVMNLAQVQVGDRVRIDYVADLLVTLRRGGKEPAQQPRNEAQARAGLPVPVGTRVVTKVVAVDPAGRTVRLEGPQGRVADLRVQDQADLVGVRVGDRVVGVVQGAVVVGLEPASK